MSKRFLFISIAMAILGGIAIGDTQANQSTIVFALCPANVKKIMSHQEKEGVVMDIKLTDSASKTFANLTRRYKGQILSLVAGGQLLSHSRIQSVVKTGRFRSITVTGSEAKNLEEFLKKKKSSVECGVSRGY